MDDLRLERGLELDCKQRSHQQRRQDPTVRQCDHLPPATLQSFQQRQRPPARARLRRQRAPIADPIVQQDHRPVVQVGDHDLAVLAGRHVLPSVVDDPNGGEVDVEVEALAQLTLEADGSGLHTRIGRVDRTAKRPLDQLLPAGRDEVPAVPPDARHGGGDAAIDQVAKEVLGVGAVGEGDVRSERVQLGDERPIGLVRREV